MIRNTFFALMSVLALATVTQAAVIIQSDAGVATPNLAGYKTFQVMAVSDSDPITAIDFVGDGSIDGAGAKGFFGAMNQVSLFGGAVSTIFADNNVVIDGQPNLNHSMDSQFSVNTSAVVVPPGLAKESTTLLQGAWAWAESPGLSVPVAQLVIPDAATGIVMYNGAITVNIGGDNVDIAVNGSVGGGGGGLAPLVADVSGQTNALGDVINLTPLDSVPGTPPVAWSALAGPTYTEGFGAPIGAPGLGTATWSWNPATQAFQFNTLGSTRGTYVWTGSATNDIGSDPFSISVDVRHVPEPATLSLFGLALAGFIGFARKRS